MDYSSINKSQNSLFLLLFLILTFLVAFKVCSNLMIDYLINDNDISNQILSVNSCSDENNSDKKIDNIINLKYKKLNIFYSSKNICNLVKSI